MKLRHIKKRDLRFAKMIEKHNFDIIGYFAPTNLEKACDQFLKNPKKAPYFKFECPFSKTEVQRWITEVQNIREQILRSKMDKALLLLYMRAIDDIFDSYHMLLAFLKKDDAEFYRYSSKIYGRPTIVDTLLEARLFSDIRQKITSKKKAFDDLPYANDKLEPLDAEKFTAFLKKAMQYYTKKFGITVNIEIGDDNIIPNVSMGGEAIYFQIPKNTLLDPFEALSLFFHEIEGHALKRANAVFSPYQILEEGTKGFLTLDEGIAMYREVSMMKKFFHVAEDFDMNISNLVLSRIAKGDDFVKIFEVLRMLQFEKEDAFYSASRFFMGIHSPGNTKGYSFTRDYVYEFGYNLVSEYLASGEDICWLYQGLIGFPEVDILRLLNIPATILPATEPQYYENLIDFLGIPRKMTYVKKHRGHHTAHVFQHKKRRHS
ncbi:DUF1704 domain-containing protein [Candidatus Peregrinibacteria bacterium]|nr:DUF1704 domain-containing protein [Candidatus Peregrinibacteria bacterium]